MDVLLAAVDISYSSSTCVSFQFTLLYLSVRLVCVRVWRAVRRVCAHEIGLRSSTAGRHVKGTCSASLGGFIIYKLYIFEWRM